MYKTSLKIVLRQKHTRREGRSALCILNQNVDIKRKDECHLVLIKRLINAKAFGKGSKKHI